MSLIENLIASQASHNVRYEAGELIRRTDQLQSELAGKDFPGFPQLRRQTAFLFDFVSKHFATTFPTEKEQSFAEAVFAVKYALDAMDYMPDFVPGIGKADDSAIVCEVLKRNEAVYQAFAAETGLDWALVQPKA